ncbi:type II toxin-antitoxin system HicB family antitoxin [Aureimonas phyllosphaerae]|uniref:type II toxin-antitoxin system HicB family antitoxin n=1 Tax=Aureimonas phyllosphaerae TaxID=1166078 RepID=UPI003A5C2554
MSKIVAIIHGKPGAYGVSFPDLPGATSSGTTIDEALERAEAALAGHVETMVAAGIDLPTLRSVEDLRADHEFHEDFAGAVVVAMVDVEMPGRAKRYNISMDERLMDRIDARAQSFGESRSGFLAAAARRRLAEEA